jgi:hypothetical protein
MGVNCPHLRKGEEQLYLVPDYISEKCELRDVIHNSLPSPCCTVSFLSLTAGSVIAGFVVDRKVLIYPDIST